MEDRSSTRYGDPTNEFLGLDAMLLHDLTLEAPEPAYPDDVTAPSEPVRATTPVCMKPPHYYSSSHRNTTTTTHHHHNNNNNGTNTSSIVNSNSRSSVGGGMEGGCESGTAEMSIDTMSLPFIHTLLPTASESAPAFALSPTHRKAFPTTAAATTAQGGSGSTHTSVDSLPRANVASSAPLISAMRHVGQWNLPHHLATSIGTRASRSAAAATTATATASSSSSSVVERNVYVASLPPNYDYHQLEELFSPVGEIEQRTLKFEDGKCKGYGFVLYRRREDAQEAVKRLHGAIVEGTRIQVRMAREQASIKASVQPGTNSVSTSNMATISINSASALHNNAAVNNNNNNKNNNNSNSRHHHNATLNNNSSSGHFPYSTSQHNPSSSPHQYSNANGSVTSGGMTHGPTPPERAQGAGGKSVSVVRSSANNVLQGSGVLSSACLSSTACSPAVSASFNPGFSSFTTESGIGTSSVVGPLSSLHTTANSGSANTLLPTQANSFSSVHTQQPQHHRSPSSGFGLMVSMGGINSSSSGGGGGGGGGNAASSTSSMTINSTHPHHLTFPHPLMMTSTSSSPTGATTTTANSHSSHPAAPMAPSNADAPAHLRSPTTSTANTVGGSSSYTTTTISHHQRTASSSLQVEASSSGSGPASAVAAAAAAAGPHFTASAAAPGLVGQPQMMLFTTPQGGTFFTNVVPHPGAPPLMAGGIAPVGVNGFPVCSTTTTGPTPPQGTAWLPGATAFGAHPALFHVGAAGAGVPQADGNPAMAAATATPPPFYYVYDLNSVGGAYFPPPPTTSAAPAPAPAAATTTTPPPPVMPAAWANINEDYWATTAVEAMTLGGSQGLSPAVRSNPQSGEVLHSNNPPQQQQQSQPLAPLLSMCSSSATSSGIMVNNSTSGGGNGNAEMLLAGTGMTGRGLGATPPPPPPGALSGSAFGDNAFGFSPPTD